MSLAKFIAGVPVAGLLAIALAGCGGDSSPPPSIVCPPPLTVQDASRITHFKAGAGRDPRDIAYEAVLVRAGSVCSLGKNAVEVTLAMIVAVSAGPAVTPGQTRGPYFVRVIDGSGTTGWALCHCSWKCWATVARIRPARNLEAGKDDLNLKCRRARTPSAPPKNETRSLHQRTCPRQCTKKSA